MKSIYRKSILSIFAMLVFSTSGLAQATEFTYQGSLNVGGSPASGDYEVQFSLFSVASGGTAIGTRTRVTEAINGVFTVRLDFAPSAFNGNDRWIEVAVRPAGSPNPFVTLLPRQPVTHVPYAFQSINARDADTAGTANNALQLGGVAAAQYVLTTDPRMSDARAPTSNSGNYIQNRTIGQQTAAGFNISGDGYVGGTFHATGTINTVTQYNLGGSRILSIGPSDSLFVGLFAGANNNSFGVRNSFFGRNAGNANIDGFSNSFFGTDTGAANTGGFFNSYFGSRAGRVSNGIGNSFFGALAGEQSIGAGYSAFFGHAAGQANTTGNDNTFIGVYAGISNTTGSHNTVLGSNTDVVTGTLSYATAIGADAEVSTSNTIQLGRTDGTDTVLVPGKLQIDTLGTAGATNLCLNGSNRVAPCSSSLRYKTNIAPFGAGLNLLNRLHPISFNWKDGGMKDVGLGAEDVAAIEPLLVTYNKTGEVEGVKYDRIGVVLVNAVQEQQTQIEAQQKQIDAQNLIIRKQHADLDALKALVCSQNSAADVCRAK